MRVTSQAQYEATQANDVPPLEEVTPGTWALPLPMRGRRLPYVISYLLLDSRDELHVIDPGWETEDSWETFVEGIGSLGRSITDIASITITHLHRDHLGLADRMRAASGAAVLMSALEQEGVRELVTPVDSELWRAEVAEWQVPQSRWAELAEFTQPAGGTPWLEADRLLADGDLLNIPGRNVKVIATAGHTAGHLCFVDLDAGLLFSGDHVLPTVYPGLGLGSQHSGDPIAQFLESLDRLEPYDAFEICPGHGYRFTGLKERRAQLAAHVLERSHRTAEVIAKDPGLSIWQVAEQLPWSSGWANLHGLHLRSALAQTAMHVEHVRAAPVDADPASYAP